MKQVQKICFLLSIFVFQMGYSSRSPDKIPYKSENTYEFLNEENTPAVESSDVGLSEAQNPFDEMSLQDVATFMRYNESIGNVEDAPKFTNVFRSSAFNARVKINVFLEPNYVSSSGTKLNLQFATVTVGGELQYVFLVSGGTGSRTPRGTFKVHSKVRWATSKRYGNAPMYYAHFFQGTSDGDNVFGIHQTVETNYWALGSAASHGCVRLHETNAARLWALTEAEGTDDLLVTIYENGAAPQMNDEQIEAYYKYLVRDNPYRFAAAPKATKKKELKVGKFFKELFQR